MGRAQQHVRHQVVAQHAFWVAHSASDADGREHVEEMVDDLGMGRDDQEGMRRNLRGQSGEHHPEGAEIGGGYGAAGDSELHDDRAGYMNGRRLGRRSSRSAAGAQRTQQCLGR